MRKFIDNPWAFRALVLGGVALGVLAATAAFAQVPVPSPKPDPVPGCAEFEVMERKLHEVYGETRLGIFHDAIEGGHILGLYVNPDKGSWTTITPVGDGQVCISNGGSKSQLGTPRAE
jgi:hypothetical protein